MRRKLVVAALSGAILACGAAAYAYINPNFTPVNLTEKADLILLLKIAPADDKGIAKAEVVKALKGKADKPQIIDLTKSANAEHAKAVREMIKSNGDGPALLFVGKGEKDEPVSKLHMGGKWVSLDKAEKAADTWEVDVIDSHMEATWAGGTDMLLKVTELLLKHPDTDVPVASSVGWEEALEAGKIAGKVGAAAAVDIGGKGEFALFVTSDAGDRVFAYDAKAKKMVDQTAKLKLGSKSAAFAWGDFNGDGKLDLASSDGKGLTIWTQGADGSFASAAVAEVPKEGCIGLAAVDVGVKGRAGLVWSAKAGPPAVLVPDRDKAATFGLKALAAGPGAIKDPAGAGSALVADFDGDLIPDVLQPYAKGSALYRGKGAGAFAEGAACDVAMGDGRTGAFLGDWDFDGRIDVHTVGEDSPRLWQNLGKGKFENLFHISGELTYISKPGCIGGNAHDFNNDGRQDVFLTYPEMGAQVFFNRGYRSFGHAHKPTDLAETGNAPEALKGTQAGCLADFNADGGQDMALVLLDGTVTVLPQTLMGDAPLAVRVALPAGGSFSGPLNVSATNDRRPLGAWAVAPGTNEALFCRADAGEVTVSWQLPGGEVRSETCRIEDRPRRFLIGTDGLVPVPLASWPRPGAAAANQSAPSAADQPAATGTVWTVVFLSVIGTAFVAVIAFLTAASRKSRQDQAQR